MTKNDEKLKARPSCCTPIQFVKWSEKQKLPPNPVDWICQDCHPEFKRRMMHEGRCDWSCVEFFMMSDGTMEGRRMSIPGPRYPGKEDGEGTRIEIDNTWNVEGNPLEEDPPSDPFGE